MSDINPLSIIWHPTPEAVTNAMWAPIAEAEGLSAEDLADGELGGVDAEGNEVESITIAQACENIRQCGCWGFVDTNTNTIHAWAADDADPSVVLHMLAHEIGHLTGDPCDDHLAEELRAETFGQVAAEAMRLYMRAPDSYFPPIFPSRGGVAFEPFDLVIHLERQREFSERTFGPGARTKGVVDNIRKELIEIEAKPDDLSEWVDVILLALDGAWRAGYTPQQICEGMTAKQVNTQIQRPGTGPLE